jgi:hypothetical protein
MTILAFDNTRGVMPITRARELLCREFCFIEGFNIINSFLTTNLLHLPDGAVLIEGFC